MTTIKFFLEFKVLAVVIISAALLCGCGGNSEEALNADNAEESASDLITFFDGAKPEIKKLAKAASEAIDASNFPLAVQNINLLKAQGANLTTDQFMVVSEAGVNLQTAMIEAAERYGCDLFNHCGVGGVQQRAAERERRVGLAGARQAAAGLGGA